MHGLTGSLRGLRDRLGSFEMPGMPNMPKSVHIPRPININFPSNLTSDWNLKVRISKFSRKWFYGCNENPSNIDEYQIRNENGRVVITPIQEKKDYENEDQIPRAMLQNRENSTTPISSISTTTEPSDYLSEGIISKTKFKSIPSCLQLGLFELNYILLKLEKVGDIQVRHQTRGHLLHRMRQIPTMW